MMRMPSSVLPPDMPAEVAKLLEAIGGKLNTEILRLLAVNSMTTAELSKTLEILPGSVHRVLRVLEDEGLVSANVPPDMRRRGSRLTWSTDVDAVRTASRQWLAYVTGE